MTEAAADRLLIGRFNRGDAAAFDEIVARYRGRMQRSHGVSSGATPAPGKLRRTRFSTSSPASVALSRKRPDPFAPPWNFATLPHAGK